MLAGGGYMAVAFKVVFDVLTFLFSFFLFFFFFLLFFFSFFPVVRQPQHAPHVHHELLARDEGCVFELFVFAFVLSLGRLFFKK
jgi:hypothetical protein